jgi:hypothetical protein
VLAPARRPAGVLLRARAARRRRRSHQLRPRHGPPRRDRSRRSRYFTSTPASRSEPRTAGCNWDAYCQTGSCPRARTIHARADPITRAGAGMARDTRCGSVAFTYKTRGRVRRVRHRRPRACRERGVAASRSPPVMSTPRARELFAVMDARQRDSRPSPPILPRLCAARSTRLDTLRYVARDTACCSRYQPAHPWPERRGRRDRAPYPVLREPAGVPLHSRPSTHPDHRLRESRATPASTCARARASPARGGCHVLRQL